MDDTPLKAKITVEDTRVFVISKQTTLRDLKQEIRQRFPYHLDRFQLRWNDGGDRVNPVTVSSDDDWKAVLCSLSDTEILSLSLTPIPQDDDSRPSSSTCIFNISQAIAPKPSLLTDGVEINDRNSQSIDGSLEDKYGQLSLSSNHSTEGSPVAQPSDDFSEENAKEESEVKTQGVDHQDSPPSSGQQTPTDPSLGDHINYRFPELPHHAESISNGPWPVGSGDTLSYIKVQKPAADRIFPKEVFDLNSTKRKGKLLLINNKKYSRRDQDLRGTDFDATSLSILFKGLGFEVKTTVNLDVRSLREYLRKEVSNMAENHGKYGCYCVVVMGKCDEHNLYDKDLNPFPFEEVIGKCVEILPGKPKLIFVEGLQHDQKHLQELTHHDSINPRFQCRIPVGSDQTDACPSPHNDLFFYLGGTLGEGLPTIKGSLMLQAFVKAMYENVHTHSFQEIRIKMEELMENAVSKTDDFRMPTTRIDCLSKDLYFV